jgi:hypothetical protein
MTRAPWSTAPCSTDTGYGVYLLLDTWASGRGAVVETFMTNDVGDGPFHLNTRVTREIHTWSSMSLSAGAATTCS